MFGLIYSTLALNTIAKNMSNGKDFYVELRKQVTALQQSGERAGMYNILAFCKDLSRETKRPSLVFFPLLLCWE